jgi:hypothetical protein
LEAGAPTICRRPLAKADAFWGEVVPVLAIFLDIQRITIEFPFDFDPVNHAPIAGPIWIARILPEAFSTILPRRIISQPLLPC